MTGRYLKRIKIAPSRIKGAGTGVFSKKYITKGTNLGYYKGKEYDAITIKPKDLKFLDKSQYVMGIFDKYGNVIKYVDSSDKNKKFSNWTRYINGVKDPKQKPNVKFIQKRTRVHIIAIKNIPPNKELIVDYGEHYEW
tara:strand:+ start:1571 stop:1984 length:414 start_codon:yes stop_codon:yes gene_type:complete